MNTIEDPLVANALDTLRPPRAPDVEGALRRQRTLQARTENLEFGTWGTLKGWRPQILSTKFQIPAVAAAIAAALVLSLLITPVRSLAAQVLPMFRTHVQDVTPITLEHLSQPMPDLTKFGDMSPNGPKAVNFQPTQVTTLADASGKVGFNVLTPASLPTGLSNQPVMAVTQGQSMSFTFRAAKAQAYLDSINRKDISLPAKFDGATLTVHIEPAATLAYLPPGTNLASLKQAASSASGSGKPDGRAVNALLNGSGLLMVETKAPSLEATGVSADDLRNFLLSLPGIPPGTKQQLAAIRDWTQTLPIPASSNSNLHKVQVKGAPGVAGQNGSANMVVWLSNGTLYSLTGQHLDEKTLLNLAASMK